jgi:serine phosphatase RsbU (regulator of sigma subunit)
MSLRDSSTFLFYKPILFRQGTSDEYFRGLVRLEVDISTIKTQILQEQRTLLGAIGFVAVIAILLGFAGAFIVATMIISPILRLVRHIEFIRDTEDQRKLEGHDIAINTNDELSVLGDAINQMTHNLARAAIAAQDLSIGKDIQKRFIPLNLDSEGNKLTTGYEDTPNAEFFGYYEGAVGVSGDYFNYQSLDGRYYAIIKCDVAGKGIPAALIMIQVATMFINFFKNWNVEYDGFKIDTLVYQINEFIETLGFAGRFAAFTLCLFDSESGIVRFCNAGDNIVHWYDTSEGELKAVTLPETPATGVLSNAFVETKSGYRVQQFVIDHDDILLLYTDGIDESKRLFRNESFELITCGEGEPGAIHGTHVSGQGNEECGGQRMNEIIHAVMHKSGYKLYKYHNPEGEISLDFDYSACGANPEDMIMAMISAEKLFRLYKNPATPATRVLVDQKVDAFLKSHFTQYSTYIPAVIPSETTGYVYYIGVQEDEQYDDLTILGVKRK